MRRFTLPILSCAALLVGAAVRAEADFIRAYAWVTIPDNTARAAPGTLAEPTCHKGVEPCTHTNYDLTFTVEGLDLNSWRTNTTSNKLGDFLQSSLFPIHNKVYQNGESDATSFMGEPPVLFEFVGNGTFTGTPDQPQKFIIGHDDGVTLTVNGQIVEQKPQQTPFVISTGTYTGGAGTNLPFQLVYIQSENPPGILETSLLGPGADPNPPPPGDTPVLSKIVVDPQNVVVAPGGSVAFHATGVDQFGNTIAIPNLTWSIVTSNSSSITGGGTYTAGPQPSTSADTIIAKSGGIVGLATALIQASGGFQIDSISADPNPVSGAQTTVTVTAHDTHRGTLGYSWSAVSARGFTFDHQNSAQSGLTIKAAGNIPVTATVTSTSFPGVKLTATVNVEVLQTATRVEITPSRVAIQPNESANLQATLRDQFGDPMDDASIQWSAGSGGRLAAVIGASNSLYPNQGTVDAKVLVTAKSQLYPNAAPGQAEVDISGPGGSFDISNAHAYPVPWKSSDPLPYVTFTGLAAGTDLKIYTSDRRLVRTLHSDTGEDKFWHTDNDSGKRVASGVYFYRITNPTSGQTVKGKLVIIQ